MITGIGILAAAMSGISHEPESRGFQALFLIASAWLLVFGVMRLFWTGAMWVLTTIFDWFADAIPRTAVLMDFLRRAYWVFAEIFLSVAFLATLIASVLVAFGSISVRQAQAEPGGQPTPQRSAPLLDRSAPP